MKAVLEKERKTLIRHVSVLFFVCLLTVLSGLIFRKPEFRLYKRLMPYEMVNDPSALKVSWEGKELPLTNMEILNNVLIADVQPTDPGTYTIMLEDGTDHIILYDTVYVGPMKTAYSLQTGNFTGDGMICMAVTLFFIGLTVINFRQYSRLKGPLLYTYDAILTCGVALFASVTSLLFSAEMINRIQSPYNLTMRSLYELLGLSGTMFMVYTSPLVLIFSILMIISNIQLLRHEPFRLQNVLGLGIGVSLIGADFIGLGMNFLNYSGSVEEMRTYYTVISVYGTVFMYFECILMASVICGFRAARHIPVQNQDYILILGCGFRKDGTLPPLLRGRVDKAVEFWRKQLEQTGKMAVLIPSGGQGSDEPVAEAEAMSRYILSCGVPPGAVMKEDRSVNTLQNMQFSKKLIEERETERDQNVIYVTTNYHVFRSGVWSGLAGLWAEGLGSRTVWWFWPNAFVRECIGLLVARVREELFWLVILASVFAGLSVLAVW